MSTMLLAVYQFLVNRHSGIRSRYLNVRNKKIRGVRVVAWLYLLWLNFCYYCLFCHFLEYPPKIGIYEKKRLLTGVSESAECCKSHMTVEEMLEKLQEYDVISFDIFDTLIFRPFSEPTDLFFFLTKWFAIPDIKRIRTEQEAEARKDCFLTKGHYEVELKQIWERMEREVGIDAKAGMAKEQELEKWFCYANPFMKQVFEDLRKKGKRIILVSDMYLPEDFLQDLLTDKGYDGIEKIFVSCEYGCGKGDGGLYAKVRQELGSDVRMIHVGDNLQSDVKMARKVGIDALFYPNPHAAGECFRPYDMSPLMGSAYRGVVDNYLYAGGRAYSMEYEYGFLYGGLFAVGYCQFIHDYCEKNGVDKILFLSRDGDILMQVYNRMFPGARSEYVYWSRTAATKLMAIYNRYDYFRRFLYHKRNQKLSVHQILRSMELENLETKLSVYCDRDASGRETGIVLQAQEELTNQNADALKRFLQMYFEEIEKTYRPALEAARRYYEKALAGANRAAAVDIGWAGSGPLALAFLTENVWKLPCELRGILAGTNTLHNAEPDAAEAFLQNGKLTAYLFSQSHNRDVMKKHDLNKDYNVYWELLVSSPQRQFLGFGLDEAGEVELHFGEQDVNAEGIQEIQRGILDFAKEYLTHFKAWPDMCRVSGRDAYAPMLLASGHGEKYLKHIAKQFHVEKGIN